MSADERATVRVPVSLPATLDDGSERGPQPAETVDLSPAGAGVLSAGDWAIGASLRFSCTLPSRDGDVAIDVRAEVRWRAEIRSDDTVLARDLARYGLAFARPTRQEEDRIVKAILYLETNAPR